MIFEGHAADLSAAVQQIAYQPGPNFTGWDTVILDVNDRGWYGTGGPQVSSDNSSVEVESALGVASYFDIFALADIDLLRVNTEGPIAGGGQLKMESFNVTLEEDLSAGQDTIIAGEHLEAANGVVNHGNAVFGETGLVDPTVYFADSSHAPRQASPLDFSSISSELQGLAVAWGLVPQTGQVEADDGRLQLVGDNLDLNIFTIDHNQLEDISAIQFETPPGAFALLNVKGGAIEKTSFGVELQGVTERGVLVNFFEATDLSLSAVNFETSILAPNADVSISQMFVAGNVVARSIQFEDGHTRGERLAGEPFENPPWDNFHGDESGEDEPSYTLTWSPDTQHQNIRVWRQSEGVIEVSVDGMVWSVLQESRLSRLVFIDRTNYDSLTIDPTIKLPIELSGLGPVAYDDRAHVKRDGKVRVDVLENDLAGPAALDPGSVTILRAPVLGDATVRPKTGQILYQPSKDRLPSGTDGCSDELWYTVSDFSGNTSTPRRLRILIGGQDGLGER